MWLRPFWVLADSNISLQSNKKPALQWVSCRGVFTIYLEFWKAPMLGYLVVHLTESLQVQLQRKIGREGRKAMLPLVLSEHFSGRWKLLGEALLLEDCSYAFS